MRGQNELLIESVERLEALCLVFLFKVCLKYIILEATSQVSIHVKL